MSEQCSIRDINKLLLKIKFFSQIFFSNFFIEKNMKILRHFQVKCNLNIFQNKIFDIQSLFYYNCNSLRARTISVLVNFLKNYSTEIKNKVTF